MKHKRLAALILGLVAVFLVAACSSDPTATPVPTQSSGPQPTPTKERLSMKYGLLSFVSTEWGPFVAQSEGFYDREGLDVEFVFVGGFGDLNTVLLAGEVDAILGAITTPMLGRPQGQPVKLIMAGHNTREDYNNWYAALPTSESGISSLDDVRGRTVNMFAEGSFAWTVAHTYLDSNGLLDDVDLVGLPFQEAYPGLVTGRADVGIFIEPFFSLGNEASMEEFGEPLNVVWTFEDALGMDDIVLASPGLALEQTIADKSEELKRFVTATINAQYWGWKEENRPRVREIIAEWTNTDVALINKALLAPGSLNGRFPKGQLLRTQQLLNQAGSLTTPPLPDDDLFDMRFVRNLELVAP
jgi:ABC-type nitrate/sulfonate/bicarbonate transport system substrate-binding protein